MKDHLNLQCIKYLCALCPVKKQHARKGNWRFTEFLTGICFTDIEVEAKVEIKLMSIQGILADKSFSHFKDGAKSPKVCPSPFFLVKSVTGFWFCFLTSTLLSKSCMIMIV